MLLIQVWEEKQYAFRAMVRAVLLDQSSIDDVLQEAFARVLQSRKDFSDRREAFHYLRKTVLSTTIDLYRRSRRYSSRIVDYRDPPEFSNTSPQKAPDPLKLLVLRERDNERRLLINQVKAELAQLPPTERQAIELFFGRSKEKKLKEICREAGIPYSTLRSRVIRGVDQIRSRLKENGVTGFSESEEVETE